MKILHVRSTRCTRIFRSKLILFTFPFALMAVLGLSTPAIAQTDQERVRISAWVGGLGLLGTVVSSFAGLGIEHWGYAKAALLYTLIILPFFYLPFSALRERSQEDIGIRRRLDFRQNLSLTSHNRPFQIIVAINALCTSSIFILQTVFPFVVTGILGLSEGYTVYLYVSGLVASLVCYPLITWLVDRWGKHRVFAGSLLASAVVVPGLILIGDWLPVPLLLAGIAWVVLEAIALSGATTLQPTFVADIVDEDAKAIGQRREGAFYAASEFIERIVYGIAGAILPLILLLGSSSSGPRGALGIRIVSVVSGLFLLLAFLLFRYYPLRPQPVTIEDMQVK